MSRRRPLELLEAVFEVGLIERDPWLDALTLSEAWVACMGAGPWTRPRRATVQAAALDQLAGRDLAELAGRPVTWFPLAWQNRAIEGAAAWGRDRGGSFDAAAWDLGWRARSVLLEPARARRILAAAGGFRRPVKVVSLFTRDALELPAFPLDRHVRRWLEAQGLPLDEEEVIAVIAGAGLDPSALNRAIFGEGSGSGNAIHRSRSPRAPRRSP